ncbi:MAG: CBS domain-containing protein [Myxococcales bacterium]|nr:CBS domain-containing protein [Myxococcales bacterium]
MRARELMTYPALTVHVNDSLAAAAHLMWQHDCGSVAVVNDEGRLASIITDRDLCMAAYTQGKPLEDMLVNSAMAKHVVCGLPDQSADDLERLMAEHQVRRIPIVDDDHRPIGLVSISDLALECVRPASHLKEGRVARTLASIHRPRVSKEQGA